MSSGLADAGSIPAGSTKNTSKGDRGRPETPVNLGFFVSEASTGVRGHLLQSGLKWGYKWGYIAILNTRYPQIQVAHEAFSHRS
jgi:hypothetical protein